MGFGKFLLGGVCTVGAIIAAPIVVPAAGLALAGSAITGAAGLTVGLGMATASATTVAAVAGVTVGAASVASGVIQEKKLDEARSDGKKAGWIAASNVYEPKLKKQADEFFTQVKNYKEHKEECDALIDDLFAYIAKLEAELKNYQGNTDDIKDEIAQTQNRLDKLKKLRVA